MKLKILLSLMLITLTAGALAQTASERYVRTAELEIAPGKMAEFNAAIQEEIKASIAKEPEVLALHAVFEKERPNHVRVFEIYVSEASYRQHVQTEHFRKFRQLTDGIVVSRTLTEGIPIILGAK
jgi:quinol monooxygenase YgiN